MGDIKKLRKKYVKPGHPWQRDRIRSEILLVGKYGLRNKREVWIARTLLGDFRRRAREVLSLSSAEKEEEEKGLMRRLRRLGLVSENANIDDVLDLTLPNILERRLQTIVYKLGLAKSVHQSRQLIVHGHIAIKGCATTSPGRLVGLEEEAQVTYAPGSPFMNRDLVKEEVEEHPKEQKKSVK
ncbi:MAG: 30S ribosomal protein S4 [Promethearchaeati archaeon SRVP18_Atabeyarchaeia-1]